MDLDVVKLVDPNNVRDEENESYNKIQRKVSLK